MAEYKCIRCGEQRKSGTPCTCPACGYKMYEMPYDRWEVLLDEIRGFIKRLELGAVEREDLSYYRLVPKKEKNGEDPDQK